MGKGCRMEKCRMQKESEGFLPGYGAKRRLISGEISANSSHTPRRYERRGNYWVLLY